MVGEKVKKKMIADGGIVSLDLSDNNNGLFIIKIQDVEYASNEYITKVVKVEMIKINFGTKAVIFTALK